MKPYYLALILFSCSKQIPERPLEPISMTQTRLMYDQSNKYEGTRLVIHFHRVDDPYLIKQYKALPTRQVYCNDANDTLVTEIARPCGDNCQLK